MSVSYGVEGRPGTIDRLVTFNTIRVLTVDPGKTTGICAAKAVWKGTFLETIQAVEPVAMEVVGDVSEQVQVILGCFASLQQGAPENSVGMVCESFQLRTAHAELQPVQILAGLSVALDLTKSDHPRFNQTPTEKAGVKSERLKQYGLFNYGVGSEHKRDALRHLAVFVNKWSNLKKKQYEEFEASRR